MDAPARRLTLICAASALTLVACLPPSESGPSVDLQPEGWTDATHGQGAEPDYDRVFPATAVQRIDIVIDADVYASMQDNMVDLYGEAGTSGGMGGGGTRGGGGGGSVTFATEEPEFFPCTVQYDGLSWWQVGVRYKGNSSLSSGWTSGVKKLPFRLDFDEFEDDNPGLVDQRFYGFKKLTFSNGYSDNSLIREKLGGELFAAAGVRVARSAFYAVYFDVGDGPVYGGLYTMVEDPSNRFLDSQFEDDSGNLYKPDGDGATWGAFDEEAFVKKTNEDDADFSDVIAAIDALHSSGVGTEAWRNALESTFDVYAFLTLLAVNQTIQNWDSYGVMTHNYYLYGDPSQDNRLVWIPWDLNESMTAQRALSVMLNEVGDEWPVIRQLLDDPVYRSVYVDELQAFLDGGFDEQTVQGRMLELHETVLEYGLQESAPYTALDSAAAFEASLEQGSDPLLSHVTQRRAAVLAAIESEAN